MSDARVQTRLLTRTFFSRLFETELMPSGLAPVQLVVGVTAFLAAPALVAPILLAKKYVWIVDPETMRAMMAQDRTIALLLAMTATALVTLVIWENIFPDARDSRHLGVLPIARRTFVAARLAAVLSLFGVVFLLPTLVLSVMLAIVGTSFGAGPGLLAFAGGQFVAAAAAEAFVFFGIVAAQCALLSVLGANAAQRAAMAVQIVLVILLLQMPMLLPPREAFFLAGDAPGWTGSTAASLLPAFWFLALFECLAGYPCGPLQPWPSVAAILGFGVPVAALALYAGSYRRLTRLAMEGRPAPRQEQARGMGAMIPWLAHRLARTPEGAAVCVFTLRTLVRSRQHRMLLAAWLGVALALVLSSLVSLFVRIGPTAIERPRTELLAAPLIIALLILAATRMLIAIPTEVKANWTFRLRQPLRLADGLAGASAAMILAGVLPAMVIALLSATWLWGIVAGVQHTIVVGMISTIVAQLLMRGVDKLPFTCTYYPGKAKIGKFWPAYLTAFTTLTYAAASVEVVLLRSPRAYLAAVAALGIVAAALTWARRREAEQLPALRFEEEPVDALTVIVLG